MASVCPTVTPYDTHQYREQVERVAAFAKRMHLDFMDGEFVETKSPLLIEVWRPEVDVLDIHLMYKNPVIEIAAALKLNPSLIIIHAEAENVKGAIEQIKSAGVKAGLALLMTTPASAAINLIDQLDYVLVFSGSLGHYGGHADLSLLSKVQEIKDVKPSIEIGWDGGINDQNVRQLVDGGVDVLNAGGFIQRAESPAEAYNKLQRLIS